MHESKKSYRDATRSFTSLSDYLSVRAMGLGESMATSMSSIPEDFMQKRVAMLQGVDPTRCGARRHPKSWLFGHGRGHLVVEAV